jgi:hypothetical protein
MSRTIYLFNPPGSKPEILYDVLGEKHLPLIHHAKPGHVPDPEETVVLMRDRGTYVGVMVVEPEGARRVYFDQRKPVKPAKPVSPPIRALAVARFEEWWDSEVIRRESPQPDESLCLGQGARHTGPDPVEGRVSAPLCRGQDQIRRRGGKSPTQHRPAPQRARQL